MVGLMCDEESLFENGSAPYFHRGGALENTVISSVQYLVDKFAGVYAMVGKERRENFQLNHETCTMFAPREINSSLD